MKRSDFRFLDRLRVRWAEVDMQKIVFNGHYLMYFDTAVAGYWRAMALPYHETMEQLQGDLFVRKATLEYEASAHLDDLLEVGVRCARIGNSSLTFEMGVLRGETLLVRGMTHDFIKMGRALKEAGQAQALAADALQRAWQP